MDEPIDDETFEDWVFEAIDGLPETFRSRLGQVAIIIEDHASDELLRQHGAATMFGFYVGWPETTLAEDRALAFLPSRLTIFRDPFLATYTRRDDVHHAVGVIVRHEVAHHFGISDDRLHDLSREHGGH